MEKNNETNPWANPTQIEDILVKEVFPKLNWDDIKNLRVSMVDKAWRALFTSNKLWKSFLQNELPFIDFNNTIDYYKKFKDTIASFYKISCAHTDADTTVAKRICPCIQRADHNPADQHTVYYTRLQEDYFIKPDTCQCHDKIPTKEYLQFPLLCRECYEEKSLDIYHWKGCSQTNQKTANATWIHKEISLLDEIQAAVPIPNSHNLVAITNNEPQRLVLLTINGDNIEQEDLAQCNGDSIRISNSGKYVAVYAKHGTNGFVYNLHDKRVTFIFDRAPIHLNQCAFPVALFNYENKDYLIAGKTWNRIDLYDPESGESLRERDLTDHHLEYFWSSLHVSPDQKTLCTYGWVWQPDGYLCKFSIEDWMTGDLYAMEKFLRVAEGAHWDYPLCWIDNNTVALWTDSRVNWAETGKPIVRSVKIHQTNDNNGTYTPIQIIAILFIKFSSNLLLFYGIKNDLMYVPELRKTFRAKSHVTTTNVYAEELGLLTPLERSPLVFDENLICLNPRGVVVVDIRDSHVLFIRNQREVSQILCYNQYSKQVVSVKKNQANMLVLSSIHYD